MTVLKPLLASIVDYAGLFPPAQLSLLEAMKVYDRAQSSPYCWLLDRFVIPASRLPELVRLLPKFDPEVDASHFWPLSVILSQNWTAELEQIQQMTQDGFLPVDRIQITAWEIAPLSPVEIQQVCVKLPVEVDRFFEIPVNADLAPYLNVLQQTSAAAKLRTGGITSNAFPDSLQLSQQISSLVQAQIPFKATAGLHHALRGNYHLTARTDSAFAAMQGFLNLAILTGFAAQQSLTWDQAAAILEVRSITSFQFTSTAIGWRDRSLSLSEIEYSRQQCFRAFGCCSVQEPIDDLHLLGFSL